MGTLKFGRSKRDSHLCTMFHMVFAFFHICFVRPFAQNLICELSAWILTCFLCKISPNSRRMNMEPCWD